MFEFRQACHDSVPNERTSTMPKCHSCCFWQTFASRGTQRWTFVATIALAVSLLARMLLRCNSQQLSSVDLCDMECWHSGPRPQTYAHLSKLIAFSGHSVVNRLTMTLLFKWMLTCETSLHGTFGLSWAIVENMSVLLLGHLPSSKQHMRRAYLTLIGVVQIIQIWE